MRNIMRLAALATFCGALAFGDSWSGKLLDATCIDQQKPASCDPTTVTVTFAITVSGKTYRLDDAGNAKAVEAMKVRTQAAAKPAAAGVTTAVTAKVNGTLEGEIIRVDTIDVQ